MKREGPRYSMRGLNCFRAIRSPVAAKIPVGRWFGGIGVVAAPAVIPAVIPPVAAVPAVAPHHRSPTSAAKPAGQDLGTPSASGMADTTAPNAAECQSFLDNLIAQFGTFESGNDPMKSNRAEHQTSNLGGCATKNSLTTFDFILFLSSKMLFGMSGQITNF
jgi:hypothetical protein